MRRLDLGADAEPLAGIIVDADDLIAESELSEERTCALDGRCVREKNSGRAKRAHTRRLRCVGVSTRIVSERVQAPVCLAEFFPYLSRDTSAIRRYGCQLAMLLSRF